MLPSNTNSHPQDVHRSGLEAPVLVDQYRQLFAPPHTGQHYVNSAIAAVSGLRQLLRQRVLEVLPLIDAPGTALTPELAQLRDCLAQLPPQHVYTLKLFFLKQIFKERGKTCLDHHEYNIKYTPELKPFHCVIKLKIRQRCLSKANKIRHDRPFDRALSSISYTAFLPQGCRLFPKLLRTPP